MKKSLTLHLVGCLCLAAVAVPAAAADDAEPAAVNQQEVCCFENRRFSGTCKVTPGTDESCGDILAYLNNPKSVGKNYCGNTKVHVGWTEVPGDGEAAADAVCEAGRLLG